MKVRSTGHNTLTEESELHLPTEMTSLLCPLTLLYYKPLVPQVWSPPAAPTYFGLC